MNELQVNQNKLTGDLNCQNKDIDNLNEINFINGSSIMNDDEMIIYGGVGQDVRIRTAAGGGYVEYRLVW